MIFSSCLRRLGQYGSTPPSFPLPLAFLLPPTSPPYSMDSIKNIHGIRGSWFLGKLFFGVLWEIKVRDFPTVECFRAVFDYIPWSEKNLPSDLRCPGPSLRPCEISRRSVFQDCSRFGSKSVSFSMWFLMCFPVFFFLKVLVICQKKLKSLKSPKNGRS